MYHVVELYFPQLDTRFTSKCLVWFLTENHYEMYTEIIVRGKDGKDYKGRVVNDMYVDELPERLAKTVL